MDEPRDRQGEERHEQPTERSADQGRRERDRRMQRHGLRGDPRTEDVVLDLLVDEDVPDRPEARCRGGQASRGSQEGDQDRHGAADVGPHDRDELRDEALEDRQRRRERDVG